MKEIKTEQSKPYPFKKNRFESNNHRPNRFPKDNFNNHHQNVKMVKIEADVLSLQERIKKLEAEREQEKEKLQRTISNQVNWGIRTISYTSLVISLGLTMILAVIALTFKINTTGGIGTWELIGIIFAIFAFLSLSYSFLIWWINRTIIHRKTP